MTEKIARRGTRIRVDYSADVLEQTPVAAVASGDLVTLLETRPLAEVRAWLAARGAGSSHQGFPVVTADGTLRGVITRRDVWDTDLAGEATVGRLVHRPPAVIFPESSCREAADHMIREGVGRLVVVERSAPRRPVGILTRSDLLGAHEERVAGQRPERPVYRLWGRGPVGA